MKLNQDGIDLIKHFEQCRLKAYPDPATGKAPWTIGWGATGEGIGPNVTWTQEQCDQRLVADLASVSARVLRIITVPCTDNQFSAMISLAYNIGLGNLKSSTLLKLVNSKDFSNASKEFCKWSKANGKVMGGLLTRREAEEALFLKA